MFTDVVKSIAKNTSVMLLQYVVTVTSTFVLMLFLPRHLGPVEYGRLYLAISIIEIFRIFVSYGGSYLIAKDVSRAQENTPQILMDAVGVRFIFAVFSLIGVILIPIAMGYSDRVRLVLFIYGLSLLWQPAVISLYACYQGREMMVYTSAGTVTERVFSSAVGVVAVLLGAKSAGVAVVFIVGSFLNFLVLAGLSKRILQALPRINWHEALRHVKKGLPYFLFTVFGSVYYRIDSIMLSKMTEEHVVGWYGAAHRLFESLNAIPYILSVALYPTLSRLWKDEPEIHRRTTCKSVEYMVLLGVFVTVGSLAFARDVIEFFFGASGYASSIPVFQVLSLGLIFLFVDMVLGTCLLASDKQKQLSVISLLAIPVITLLNFILIPYFQTHGGNGAIGSAAAIGITEILIMLSVLRLLPKGILQGFRFSVVVKSISAGIVMAAALFVMNSLGVPFFVQLVAGSALYAGAVFLMGTFEPQEQQFIRSLFDFGRLKRFSQSILPE